MPSQPPRFSLVKAAPRKAWASSSKPLHKRIRGRAGMKLRAQVLREEPLCRNCLEQGRTTASSTMDHIVPLAGGGSNDRSNLQGLCQDCHDAKSKAERAKGRGAGRISGPSGPDTGGLPKFLRGQIQRGKR